MKRKLVRQGPTSLTVSLPASWVQERGLDAGTCVDLFVENHSLIITANTQEKTGVSTTIDVRKFSDKMITYVLGAAHKKGFDEIKLVVEPEQNSRIEQYITRSLIGYEIVDQTQTEMTVRFVLNPDFEEFPALLRRAFLVTLAMAEGTIFTKTNGKELLVLEESNNRIVNFCERLIVKNNVQEKNGPFYYIIVWLLEKIADHYKELIEQNKLNRNEGNICLRFLREYYELFYCFDPEKNQLYHENLKKEIQRFTEKESPYLPILLNLDQTKASTIAIHL